MTTYKFFSDYIEMTEVNSKGTFVYSSNDELEFILATLRTDFLLMICQTSSNKRSRYKKIYNALLDIRDLCKYSIPSVHIVVKLVRDILSFSNELFYKNFRIIFVNEI